MEREDTERCLTTLGKGFWWWERAAEVLCVVVASPGAMAGQGSPWAVGRYRFRSKARGKELEAVAEFAGGELLGEVGRHGGAIAEAREGIGLGDGGLDWTPVSAHSSS